MSKRYRINITRWLEEIYEKEKPLAIDEAHEHQEYLDNLKTLLDELERSYDEIDSLRESIGAIRKVMLKYADEEY